MHPVEKTKIDKQNKDTKVVPDTSLHLIIVYSYLSYFTALLLGILFDFLFPHKFFEESIMTPVGFVLLISASFLIFWAQKSSRNFNDDDTTKESFCNGPYYFLRMPTYLGLFLLVLGFGMIVNATFVILFSIFSFLFSKLLFVRKEETLLENKYGNQYLEYKKSVRF